MPIRHTLTALSDRGHPSSVVPTSSQSVHAETHFESPTGDADVQLRQFIQRFGIPSTEILFAPTLERFLMIAARCLEALIFDMLNMPLPVLAVYLRSWSDPVRYLDYDQALRDFIETVQLLGLAFCNDVVAVTCSHLSPHQGSNTPGNIP